MFPIIKKAFQFNFDSSKRIVGLDIYRSAAILLVLFAHFLQVFSEDSLIVNFIYNFSGYIGVELFFVLSGFLIGGILVNINERSENFNLKVIRKFWIRRWFRTLPAYYLMIFINAILFYFANDQFIFSSINGWSYILFLQNFINQKQSFFSESWSLCIEEWFYLLIPLFIFFFSFLKKSRMQKFIIAVIFFYLLIMILKLVVVFNFELTWGEVRRLTPLRLSSILYGVIAACINFYYKDSWINKKNIFFAAGILFSALTTYLFITQVNYGIPNKESYLVKVFLFDGFSISFAFLLPFFSQMKKLKITWLSTIFIFISTISYSMYLIHVPVLKLLSVFHFSSAVYYIFCWIVSIALSTVIYNLYEHPFTDLREKFSK